MADLCPCGASLGTNAQLGLPATGTAAKCIRCQTKDRIRHMLAMLPSEGDSEFDDLTEFEHEFLPSVREQFARKGALSEKQYEILERIYEKAS